MYDFAAKAYSAESHYFAAFFGNFVMQVDKLLSKKHFAALSKEVHELLRSQTWWQKHGYELLMFGLRVLLFAVGFFIFAQTGWFWKALGMVVLSYAFYGIGITGTHESRHSSFVTGEQWNRFWGYFFSDFWAGQSNLWWHHRHVVTHHVYTNVPDKEPRHFYYPWINRYVYFFGLPYFVTFWLFLHSLWFLRRQRTQLILFFLVQTAGWVFHVALFALVVSLPYAFLSVLIMRSLFAPIFVHLAVFNHIGLEDPLKRLPWLPHQTRTTRNLKPNWFINAMGGNAFVECHIEHHLFPRLSNHILSKIRPIVKKYVQKEGYKYCEEGYFSCLKNCIKHYDTIFQIHPLVEVDL